MGWNIEQNFQGCWNKVELTSDKWIRGDGSYVSAILDLSCNRIEVYYITSFGEWGESSITAYLDEIVDTDKFSIDQKQNIGEKSIEFCDKVCSFFCDDVEEINRKRQTLISENKDHYIYDRKIKRAFPSMTSEDWDRLGKETKELNSKIYKIDEEIKDILEDNNIDSGDYTYNPVIKGN